jgi:hypothetical protein
MDFSTNVIYADEAGFTPEDVSNVHNNKYIYCKNRWNGFFLGATKTLKFIFLFDFVIKCVNTRSK